ERRFEQRQPGAAEGCVQTIADNIEEPALVELSSGQERSPPGQVEPDVAVPGRKGRKQESERCNEEREDAGLPSGRRARSPCCAGPRHCGSNRRRKRVAPQRKNRSYTWLFGTIRDWEGCVR